MTNKLYGAALGLLAILLSACQETPAPTAFGPCPTEDQIAWQEMERTAFIHFSMNTFNDVEWGYGDVPPETFNPSALDCNQWVSICKQAGIFYRLKGAGEKVHEGELLARIIDPYEGVIKAEITSPTDGIVFFAHNKPLALENTLLFNIL